MGGISIDAYRAMSGGRLNLGSIVVKTDKALGEQRLEKVNNSLNERKIVVPPEESRQARTLLYSLMAADLAKTLGGDDARFSQFKADLREVLLGKNEEKAQNELLRAGGDLEKAFDLFDSFKTKKLSERKIEIRTKTAVHKFLQTKEALTDKANKQEEVADKNLNRVIGEVSDEVNAGIRAAEKKIDDWCKAESAKADKAVEDAEQELERFKDEIGKEIDADEFQKRIDQMSEELENDVALAKEKYEGALKLAKKEVAATRQRFLAAYEALGKSLTVSRKQGSADLDAMGALDAKKFDSSKFKQLCKSAGVKISEKSFIRIFNERKLSVLKGAFALHEEAKGSLTVQTAIVKAVGEFRAAERAEGKAGAEASPQENFVRNAAKSSWEDLNPPEDAPAVRTAAKELNDAEAKLDGFLPVRLEEAKARAAILKDVFGQTKDAMPSRLREKIEEADAASGDKQMVARKNWLMGIGKTLDELKGELDDATAKAEIWQKIQEPEQAPAKDGAGDAAKGKFDDWKQTVADKFREAQEKKNLASAKNDAWIDVRSKVTSGDAVTEVEGEHEEVKNFRQAALREFGSAENDARAALAERSNMKKYNDENSAEYKELMKIVSFSYDDFKNLLDYETDALGPMFKEMVKAAGVKISEKSFRRIFAGRPEAVKQTAMAELAAAGGALDGDPKAAILKAVRTLRDAEVAAANNKGKPESLDKSETALFRFLKSAKTSDDVRSFLANHAEFESCLFNELQGGLRLLAGSPKTDMTLTLTIPLSADGKKKGVISLLQGGDGTLRIGYKGRTFKLESGTVQLFVAIQNSRTVTPPDKGLYENYNPETADTEASRTELKQTHEGWTESPFDGKLLNQEALLNKFDAMLDKLAEINNRLPGTYGGSPNFRNAMPMLNADGARQVKVPFVDISFRHFKFSGERPVNFMRTVLNDRIKKAPIFAPVIKLYAKCLGVPLEEAGGGQYTLFERAARYLHGMRIMAQNANYILSRFAGLEGRGLVLGTEEERKACYAICDEFSKLTQFTVHPYYANTTYSGADLAGAIRSTLVKHCRTFEKALATNQLDEFFKKIASGVCFNDCMSVMQDLSDSWKVFDESLDGYLQTERSAAAPEDIPPEDDSKVHADETVDVVTSVWAGPQRKKPATVEEPNQVRMDSQENQSLVINPTLAAQLHNLPGIEPLSSFMDAEVDALNKTYNPIGTTEPRTFSWENEVKPFLKARLDELNALRKEEAAQDEYNRLVAQGKQLQQQLLQAQEAKLKIQRGEVKKDIASVEREIEECEAELAKLKNREYLEKTVREAEERAGLRFSWIDDESDEDWMTVKDGLNVERKALAEGDIYSVPEVDVRYDGSPKFWDFVEKLWAEADGRIKKDDAKPLFVRGAERPYLKEALGNVMGDWKTMKLTAHSTKIVEILPSGERKDAVAYERAVHGDKNNFIKIADEKTGTLVWRTLDGRFEIQSASTSIDKSSAAADGDAQYRPGDFIFS